MTELSTRTVPPRRPPFRRLRWAALVVLGAAATYAGHHLFWRYHLKRFQVVAPGIFYRVAQPTEFGFRTTARNHHIRTVVSLQLFDFKLYGGLFDPGHPDGGQEADFVRTLGMYHVQWPMGEEQCWPWPTPWQFEEFFRLVDDPKNHPILIHCMGGRHRTGTLSALYRLEYDGWSVDDALAEMYAFDFGTCVPVQEFNLRTYVPRPRPTATEFRDLKAAFDPMLPRPAADYAELVRALRESRANDSVRSSLAQYLRNGRPFCVALAARLIDAPDDPLASTAVEAAERRLNDSRSSEAEWLSAAAVVADFGGRERGAELSARLNREISSGTPSPWYDAVVRGLTNRYTDNRLAYLRPLLEDRRVRRNDSSGIRYCDVALVRLAAITDTLGMRIGVDSQTGRLAGHELAHAWFAANPQGAKLMAFAPPQGRKTVLAGDAPLEEDLGKLRR